MPLSDKCKSWCLLVQDNTQEGIVDLDLAVVLDEAQFPELVHEKIDPRPRCANHFRQHLLRYSGKHLLRLALRAIAREQQQSARQPFLAGVEELVDQVLLDSFWPSCVSVVRTRAPTSKVRRAHTKHPTRERSEVTPLTRLPDFNSSMSAWAAKGCRIEYRRSRTPDSLARLALSDSTQVSLRMADSGTCGSGM